MMHTFLNYLDSIPLLKEGVILFLLVAGTLILKLVLSHVFVPILKRLANKTEATWDDTLFEQGFFRYLVNFFTALFFYSLMRLWLNTETSLYHIFSAITQILIIIYILLTLFSFLDTIRELTKRKYSKTPLVILFQVVKIALASIAAIIALSILVGRSPALIVSGLGAMTAVLMLIFKDPIVGFVAGIQLSANKMLALGDWVEMPKYNADGDVIEITLTTVKVANWDKTITTIPTSAFINDSFKNWKGMFETGGRRIKRSIYIDASTVKFLLPEDIAHLKRLDLLKTYIDQKTVEISKHNHEHQVDPHVPINGRQLTNIGTFRAYLNHYIKNHPDIHKNLIAMVRQLQSTPEGIPMEIYCFTADTRWVYYENIQADIFDHIYAVIPEFGLRIHQNPGSADLIKAATIIATS